MRRFRENQVAISIARSLRRNQTEAERLMWQNLRRGRIAAHKFRRQHRIGTFVVDFACPASRLIIELDGGQHAFSHVRDRMRSMMLERKGYRILRFWNHDVLQNTDGVIRMIIDALESDALNGDSPPNPSLSGREASELRKVD